jgi:hypothetical protein
VYNFVMQSIQTLQGRVALILVMFSLAFVIIAVSLGVAVLTEIIKKGVSRWKSKKRNG